MADVSLERLERWFVRGIPKPILADPVRLAFVFTDLNALVARHDETENQRLARRHRLAYTGLLDPTELRPGDDPAMATRATRLERIRAARSLQAIGERLVREAAALGRVRTAPGLLAEALGVKRRTVEHWLLDGKVSGFGLGKLRRYQREEKAVAEVDKAERRVFRELMTAGRKPHVIRSRGEDYYDEAKGRWVYGVEKKEAPVVPTFRSSEGYFGGDATHGYRWSIAERELLSAALLQKMVREALSVPRARYLHWIRGDRRGAKFDAELPEWVVYIVVSVLYSKEGERGHPVEARSGSRRAYGANTRSDLEPRFPEHANRFVVKDAYSSGNHATLKEAVVEFEKRVWKEIQTSDLTFVHGLVVWNFRRRTSPEQALIFEQKSLDAKTKRIRKKKIIKQRTGKRLRALGREARAAYEASRKKKG